MIFARKVWRLLVAIKDGLALVFLLLFFLLLYAALAMRPNPGAVRTGALLLKLDGRVVEEPAAIDPIAALLARRLPTGEYRARDIVRGLRAAATDDRVKVVVLDLSRFLGGGQVHLQEIGAALDAVRAAKKPVLTYGTAYIDDGVMLAAHSSEVWVHPLGAAFVAGPGGKHLYYGRLLDKLKVDAHVFRVGTYKDYVEQYTRNDQSPEARQARQALYGALWANWQDNVARARPQANLKLAAGDPLGQIKAANNDSAAAAKAIGLVDRIGDRVAFGERVAQLVGRDPEVHRPGSFVHTNLRDWLAANEPKTPGRAIGVVTIAGEIVDGKAGPGTAGGDRIAKLLDDALDKDLAGLVVRVDSPGGSVMASEVIRAALERQKARRIPIAVSMANVAASGGYWVSTPGQRIFAEPSTITGSIGIFAVVPSFEKSLAAIGVTGDGVQTTPLSGQPDLLSGLNPEVEGMLQANVDSGYARFLGLVARARGKTVEQVDPIAQGRVWDGGTAHQLGLVDQFGGLDDALAWVAQRAGLADGAWHPEFLGAKTSPYASLLERLRGNDSAGPGDDGLDLSGQIAARQQGVIETAIAGAQHLLGARGAQALCLDCPSAPTAGEGHASLSDLGLLARIVRLFGLG
ncbi:MAG: signal peptide peptidase SppA [Novosphingobium sp.]|nr:signal peptide peptidase SppA [Novosphingobium sp.]